ncbi:hypothetical protein AQUCO_00700363v1 [Aquilegia coerulea]|uniref:Uncharacterized protein n=1 Tax=Aquilegia coerulea TaxID=218851 RepID=A0A2G5EJW5_AQUCA|nr:hypothetical protein AQUCO_00700363v1 [Aquilegia coerulea]
MDKPTLSSVLAKVTCIMLTCTVGGLLTEAGFLLKAQSTNHSDEFSTTGWICISFGISMFILAVAITLLECSAKVMTTVEFSSKKASNIIVFIVSLLSCLAFLFSSIVLVILGIKFIDTQHFVKTTVSSWWLLIVWTLLMLTILIIFPVASFLSKMQSVF